MTESPRVALTMGDPAGIGPEVALRACAALAADPIRPIVVGDQKPVVVCRADTYLGTRRLRSAPM